LPAAETRLRRAWPFLLLCCGPVQHAGAQLSGSVALVSDYVYRGVSLSDGAPAPQLNLNYDGAEGWYVGGFASRFKLQDDTRSGVQHIAYAGYAQRLGSGLTLDGGVSRYGYTRSSGLNFNELYASLAGDNLNARVSYSPDYLGQRARTAYLELNANYALGAGYNLYLHAGLFNYLSGAPLYSRSHTLDGRVGLGTAWAGLRWQLAWAVSEGRRGGYAPAYGASPGSHSSLILSATRPF
jgi:uncharacterized protein (TIGR02001 family)